MESLKFEKHNGKAYLIAMSEDYFNPQLVINYWEIKIDASLLPDNPYIYKLCDIYMAKTDFKDYPLYIDDLPTKTEIIPIKPPKKNGYKWQYGSWVKG